MIVDPCWPGFWAVSTTGRDGPGVSERFTVLHDAITHLRTQGRAGVVVECDPIGGTLRPLVLVAEDGTGSSLKIGPQVSDGEPVWLEPETGDRPTMGKWAGFHPSEVA